MQAPGDGNGITPDTGPRPASPLASRAAVAKPSAEPQIPGRKQGNHLSRWDKEPTTSTTPALRHGAAVTRAEERE